MHIHTHTCTHAHKHTHTHTYTHTYTHTHTHTAPMASHRGHASKKSMSKLRSYPATAGTDSSLASIACSSCMHRPTYGLGFHLHLDTTVYDRQRGALEHVSTLMHDTRHAYMHSGSQHQDSPTSPNTEHPPSRLQSYGTNIAKATSLIAAL